MSFSAIIKRPLAVAPNFFNQLSPPTNKVKDKGKANHMYTDYAGTSTTRAGITCNVQVAMQAMQAPRLNRGRHERDAADMNRVRARPS